jgi:hypothetical protein
MPRPIMVAGGEHCQLRAAIEVLVPYTSLWRRSSTSILTTVRPSSTHLVIWSSWASSPPRLSVSVGPVRAKPFHHLADQLVGELLLAT